MGGRDVLARGASAARGRENVIVGAVHRVRRRWLLARVAAITAWKAASVDIHIHPSVRIDPGVRIVVAAGSRNTVAIGPGCRLGRGLTIELDGGTLHLGSHVDLRADVVLHVGGTLRFEGPNLVQVGAIVHCDDSVTLAAHAVVSERVTIADSGHFHRPDGGWFLDNVRTAPVVLGARSWVAANATITRGVTIGPDAVVGATSTVIADVPAGCLASGVPARVVGPAPGYPTSPS